MPPGAAPVQDVRTKDIPEIVIYIVFFSMVLLYYGTFVLSMNGYTVQVH